jgi:hypothetical protein
MSALPVRVPHHMVVNKPRHGDACNRCGVCCYMTLCELGRHVFNRPGNPAYGPCPALQRRDQNGDFECGVAANPGKYFPAAEADPLKYRAAASEIIFAGVGCDARINGEPRNLKFDRMLERHDQKRARALNEARALWGFK